MLQKEGLRLWIITFVVMIGREFDAQQVRNGSKKMSKGASQFIDWLEKWNRVKAREG